MIAFEVFVNGQKIYTIGADDPGFVYLFVERGRKRFDPEIEIKLAASGVNLPAEEGLEHLEWGEHSLSLGDEIIVRVVETDSIDEPKQRIPDEPSLSEQRRREFYDQLRLEYGE